MHKNQDGFSVVEALILLLVLVIVGGSAWYVGTKHNKTAQTATQTQMANEPSATSTSPAPTGDNLRSGTLQYEKISYSYPKSWTLTDKSAADTTGNGPTPGSDDVTLTAPDGLVVSLRTGIVGVGYMGTMQPVTTINSLGGTYSLAYTVEAGANPDPNNIYELQMTENNGPFVVGKNVLSGSDPALMSFAISYTNPRKVSVSQLQADPSYQDAVAILKSLSY